MKNFNLKFSRYSEVEKYIFFLILLINAIPLVSVKYYGTLDGPAHLYNSQVIVELITNPDSWLHDYHDFNHRLVPNYLSHILLGLFTLVFPGFIAEKILILLYALALPLAFRKLIISINPKNSILSFLAFPMVYNVTFEMGFYNFNLGLVLLIFILAVIIHQFSKAKPEALILSVFLMITLYFAHLLVLLIVFMLFGFYILLEFYKSWRSDETDRQNNLRQLKVRVSYLLKISVIPFLLVVYYMSTGTSVIRNWIIDLPEKVILLLEYGSFFGVNKVYPIVYLGLIIFSITTLKQRSEHRSNPILWMLSGLVMMSALFFAPNDFAGGSFFSKRFVIFFYLFITCWLATRVLPKAILNLLVVIIFGSVCIQTVNNLKYHALIGELSADLEEASKQIEEGSVVLPISTLGNWLCDHMNNYLAIDRSMILLENYECEQDHFPLVWDKDLVYAGYPKQKFFIEDFVLEWKGEKAGKKQAVDYIVIVNSFNDLRLDEWGKVNHKIKEEYSLIYENKNAQVFKRMNKK